MKVRLSKVFTKSVDRLSGKQLKSVLNVIAETKAAQRIEDVTDCARLVGYKNIYRIRIGSLRAFLTFHIEIIDGVAYFLFLVPRGQAYTKKTETELKRIDTQPNH
jgi:mRNA-degrading endonuclease RelE of RelBE toxin-antitoxin system